MSQPTKATSADVTPEIKAELRQTVANFKGKKVLVVGDIGLDEYVLGQVRRISPEAPVPVLEVESEDKRLGLAANVALNINSLGGEAILVSVIGKDTGGELLKKLFTDMTVSCNYLIEDTSRPTTRKTRVMSGPHHIVRVDYELRKYIKSQIEAQVIDQVKKNIASVDIMVIEDYAKGVVTQTLVQELVKIAKENNRKVLVDPHRDNKAEFYKGVDLIKPNYDESIILTGLKFEDMQDNPNKVRDVGQLLKEKTGAKEVVLTRGKDGMSIFTDRGIFEVPTYAKKVFDVTGAGDTVIATLALAQAAGLDLVKSCILANHAAGIVVGKIGCVPCDKSELLAALSV